MKRDAHFLRSMVYLLILAVLLAFFASALTSALHSHHECTGETCLVCRCTALRDNLGKFLLTLTAVGLLAAVPLFFGIMSHDRTVMSHCRTSPVSLKVKLSN